MNTFRTCSRFRVRGTASMGLRSQPLHSFPRSTTWSKEVRSLRKTVMITTLILAMNFKNDGGAAQAPTPTPIRRSKPCVRRLQRTRISDPCSSWIGLRISSLRPISKTLKNGSNSQTSQRPLQNPTISK